MPVLLRINHEKTDVIFQVITDKPSTQSTLEVFIGGKTYIFNKIGNSWIIDQINDSKDLNPELADAIAKALALRFRISSSQHVI